MSRDPEAPVTLAAESVEAEPAAKKAAGIATLRAGCTALAAAILFAPFFVGFRPTADQKEWAFTGMTTPVHAWLDAARPVVEAQGRIGDYIALPLEYLAGRIGDMWFFPFLCIGILLTIVVSLLMWWSTLSRSRAVLAPFLVYLALLPAGAHHWLPNAYPTMAIPLAFSLAAKAVMLRCADRGARMPLNLACSALLFIGALTFELNLGVLAVLYVAELAWPFIQRGHGGSSPVTKQYLLWNGATLVLATTLWGTFRYAYGTQYVGNAYPSQALTVETAVVTVLHLWTASVGGWSTPIALLQKASPYMLIAALVLLPSIAFAFYFSPKAIRPWLWIGLGGMLAIGATLPISIVGKYHDWCLGSGDCGYIDSRLSLVGLAIVVTGVVSLLPRRPVVQVVVAAAVGLAAVETFLQNAEGFGARRDAFEGRELLAKRYVCGDQALGTSNDAAADRLTNDPLLVNDRNTFHPWDDLAWRKNYWLTYIDHLQHSRFWLCP